MIKVATSDHVSKDEPVVKTSLGLIKGYHRTSEIGRIYEAFEGIPFALPPTEELRFEVI